MFRNLFAALLALTVSVSARAADPVKIGLIVPLNGPFGDYGKQIEHGVDLYLAQHGDTYGGRKVQIIVRDDAPGTAGDVSKRLAQELIVKDHVNILAGFGLTPAAMAVAPVATQAKVPMIDMNAATSSITTKSPYIVRVSMTLPQNTAPIATWAAKNGIKNVYVVVADYGPGYDSEKTFIETFKAAGGQIVGDVRTPVNNPDYGPFLEKIKDAHPDAVFIFLPPGASTIAFMKGFSERGLPAAGIKLIATGDITEEGMLPALGDLAAGVVNSFHYSEAHDSPVNKAYVAAYYKAYKNMRPDFFSVGGYDGMQLIAKVLAKTHGSTDAQTFVDAAKGMAWESPRGPVSIDPETRDIVQNIYIRKVEKVNGVWQNVEFDKVPNFKDPGKAPK